MINCRVIDTPEYLSQITWKDLIVLAMMLGLVALFMSGFLLELLAAANKRKEK